MTKSKDLKIGVFAYDFEHKKTYEGLVKLFLNNHNITCVLAAPRVELKHPQSRIRIAPRGLEFMHPYDLADRLSIPYYVTPHNSEDCEKTIKTYGLDLGIILGARILKEQIIDAFNVGVLNLHPGLLPEIRGLDTIKWAILKDKKQGVTTHLIDRHIDKGKMILRKEMEVYDDDTLVDIYLRIQNLELALMVESLDILERGKRDFPPVGDGEYHKAVPIDIEARLHKAFEDYKRDYKSL